MTVNEIRQAFFDYFESRGHKIVPSAPIVIKEDPTLMFTNAGMNQFKDIFVGAKKATEKRVADTQKCLRVSGKHNDLEEVGVDHYHHTMFEMLGNWSFGDYFKAEAIQMSWEFLTEVLKIDKSRLYATVFEGDENVPFDKESFELWSKFLPQNQILKGNAKDNFWEMGDVGPCGPSTEIHYDNRLEEERSKLDGAKLVNQDHEQVIEIWNNVFIQHNRATDGSLSNLPEKHVDTGMGLERLVRVMQNKQSNYDTDVFTPIIRAVEQIASKKYEGSQNKSDIAFRVISDHTRAIVFTIADGQIPSNTGAGYVVRRVLRRAVRYAYSFLGLKEPFLNQLVQVLAEHFIDVFPEIKSQEEFIARVILEEEKSFLSTLSKGLERLNQFFESAKLEEKLIPGELVFELYDTYGFPKDLTALIASDHELGIDESGFQDKLKQQKERSRADGKKTFGDWHELNQGESRFVGYDTLSTETQVLRYRSLEQKGELIYQLVLEETPFYAESGGQIGDQGLLTDSKGNQIEVIDTQKEQQTHLHIVKEIPSEGTVQTQVLSSRREEIAIHHSGTHLLHAALKSVLGEHVEQKGSLVTEHYLRFDFSHFSKVSEEELKEVELMVNEKIAASIPLKEQRSVPYQEAIDGGVTALFGEKYGDQVRVITFDKSYSSELCGGTHVQNTSQIRLFKITAESASSAGVRRIEAVAGHAAIDLINNKLEELKSIASYLKNPADLMSALTKKDEQIANLERQLASFSQNQAAQVKDELQQAIEKHGEYELLIFRTGELAPDELKNLVFAIKNSHENIAGIIGSENKGKAMLTAFCGNKVLNQTQFKAGDLIRQVAKHIQGGGGGQPFYATAGGKSIEGIDAALEEAKNSILSQF